jgi:hypothetical protein
MHDAPPLPHSASKTGENALMAIRALPTGEVKGIAATNAIQPEAQIR